MVVRQATAGAWCVLAAGAGAWLWLLAVWVRVGVQRWCLDGHLTHHGRDTDTPASPDDQSMPCSHSIRSRNSSGRGRQTNVHSAGGVLNSAACCQSA